MPCVIVDCLALCPCKIPSSSLLILNGKVRAGDSCLFPLFVFITYFHDVSSPRGFTGYVVWNPTCIYVEHFIIYILKTRSITTMSVFCTRLSLVSQETYVDIECSIIVHRFTYRVRAHHGAGVLDSRGTSRTNGSGGHQDHPASVRGHRENVPGVRGRTPHRDPRLTGHVRFAYSSLLMYKKNIMELWRHLSQIWRNSTRRQHHEIITCKWILNSSLLETIFSSGKLKKFDTLCITDQTNCK